MELILCLHAQVDAEGCSRSPSTPKGLLVNTSGSPAGCCAACNSKSDCAAWVTTATGEPISSGMNCWLFSCVKASEPARQPELIPH